ncbi:MAG: putative LPS assembly protein LptD [Bacteroidota bacterium]
MFKKLTIKLLLALFFSATMQNMVAQEDVVKTDDPKTTQDSVSVDSTKIKEADQGVIEAPINYSAKDSMMISLKTKMIYSYGEANVEMDQMNLEAGFIKVNMDSDYIYARPQFNENGEQEGNPKFQQGSENYDVDSMKYNFETKKGIIYGVITEQAGGYLHGTKTKIQPNKEVHIYDGKFTTCDAKHPHFYIELTKAKVIPEKRIVSGPFYFVLADIPVPIGLPFGLFPNQTENQSGIIMPSYGEEKRRGFFIQNGGYYFAINDYVDLAVVGEIYSNGSWGVNLQSKYKKRYKFGGNFNINYQNLVESEPDLPDYSQSTQFRVVLNYRRDAKANPTSTFNTALNFSSSKYNKYNSYNPNDFANNNTSSSIAYTKTWPGKPFNFSANSSMNQNLAQKNVSLQLPTITFNMNKQFPFKKKIPAGKQRWYEKVSVGFNSNLKNSLNIGDSLLFEQEALDRMENGLKYTIPVSVSSKILKHIIFSPSMNYTGRVYSKYLEQSWEDYLIEGEDTIRDEGFYTDTITGLNHLVDFNVAAAFSTTLYGMKQFRRGRIAAIRHVLKPSASINFKPDFGKEFWGYYKTDYNRPTFIDEDTLYNNTYSPYDNGIFGKPAAGESGSISLSLSNNFEMKVHSKDTSEEFKKIVLLDNLRFGTSYNIAADSLNWSNISISATTKFFKKLSFQYTGVVDLYKRDSNGGRINTTYIESDRVLGHLNNSSISLSGSINSDTFKKEKEKGTDKGQGKGQGEQKGKSQPDIDEQESKKENANEVSDYSFSAPWNLNIRYSFRYTSTKYNVERQKFESVFTQTVNTTANLTLNEKWRIGARFDYNIQEKELTYWSMNFHRDLHCWEMSFNFVPFGAYQSYMFRINIKSSIFQGLEWKKQNSWRDNIDFGDL